MPYNTHVEVNDWCRDWSAGSRAYGKQEPGVGSVLQDFGAGRGSYTNRAQKWWKTHFFQLVSLLMDSTQIYKQPVLNELGLTSLLNWEPFQSFLWKLLNDRIQKTTFNSRLKILAVCQMAIDFLLLWIVFYLIQILLKIKVNPVSHK